MHFNALTLCVVQGAYWCCCCCCWRRWCWHLLRLRHGIYGIYQPQQEMHGDNTKQMGRLLSRSLKDSWMMCLVNIIYIYVYIYVANFRFFEPKLIGCLQVLYQRCIYYLKNTADTMWADVTCGAAGTLLAVIQLIQLEPGKKWSTISWDWGCNPQKLTWNLEMMVSNRNLLFQGSIFRFHVCFGWFDVPPIPQLPKPRKIHENLRLPKWIQSENLR